MDWYNKPSEFTINPDIISITADGHTDFWRKTRHGYIEDNGHFYFQEVTGNFTAEVKVTGDYATLYDQAGMMARLDELTWLKCGIEFVEGYQYASVVVTRDFSDWSVVRLDTNPESIWFRLSRYDSAFEVSYSLNGDDFHMLRQTYLTEALTIKVGLMIAAPKGDGFAAQFENFELRPI
jgi:regulation of enolase protein 1 (concanavalin A-like superfamily)